MDFIHQEMSFGPQDLTNCELFLSLNINISSDPDVNTPPAAASLRDKNVWPKFKLFVNTKCCLRGPETWSQDEQPVKIIHNWGNHVNQIWPRDTQGWGVHTWPIVPEASVPPPGSVVSSFTGHWTPAEGGGAARLPGERLSSLITSDRQWC